MEDFYLPRAVLTVNVIDVTELTGRTEWLGRYDPFVKITVGDQTAYTSVKRNAASNPDWKEAYKFPLKLEKNYFNHIRLQVFDRNIVKHHSLMGETSFGLADIPEECRSSSSWKFQVSKQLCLESEANVGLIRFSVEFQARTAADMLELNMQEQNSTAPSRAGSAGKVARKARHAVVTTLGAASAVFGFLTFEQSME